MKKGGSIDAVNKFNRMKKNEIDIKQYFILLDIIFKNPSFFCVYHSYSCENYIRDQFSMFLRIFSIKVISAGNQATLFS